MSKPAVTAPQEIIDLFKQVGTTLNQYIDGNPNDPSCPVLGEPWRTELLKIKGRLDATLETLPPTDQAPAAMEARWGLDVLKNAMFSVQAIITNLGSVIKAKSAETETAMASITGEVEKAVEAKLKAGELLLKADAEGMVNKARTEGEAAGLAKGQRILARRDALALCGLDPLIVSKAPEAVLMIEDDKAFEAHRDSAKARLEKLTGIGLAVASSTVQTLAWAEQKDFDGQFASLEEVFKANAKGQSNNSAGTEEPKDKKVLNPFLGGSGNAEKKASPIVIV